MNLSSKDTPTANGRAIAASGGLRALYPPASPRLAGDDHLLEIIGRLATDSELVSEAERRAVRSAVATARQAGPFLAFDGATFSTRHGPWHVAAFMPALMLWVLAMLPGKSLPIAASSRRAAHGWLDRAVEGLARVDLDLANRLAFAKQRTGSGLHLEQRGRLAFGRLDSGPFAQPIGRFTGPPLTRDPAVTLLTRGG